MYGSSFSFSSSFIYSRSARFVPFSRCTNDDARGVGEANRGSPSFQSKMIRFGNGLLKLMNELRVEEPRVEEPRGLKEGDVNLSDLLFTKDRDYLIKCNDGKQVKKEQLKDKVVVIYFDSICDIDELILRSLKLVYNDLKPSNNFEVVFVDINNFDASLVIDNGPQDLRVGVRFINYFQQCHGSQSRYQIKHLGNICDKSLVSAQKNTLETCLFLTKEALSCNGSLMISFINMGLWVTHSTMIEFLKSEDEKAVSKPTLKALLAFHERDYLISNNGHKVPIDTLEDKVVALFFYTECEQHQEFREDLKVVYEELLQSGQKFEVLLIYLYDKPPTDYITSEEEFSKTFKTMPWLALLFRDSIYKKLERIFFVSWDYDMLDYCLTIIGPHMEFIQPFDQQILRMGMSPVYPFTCEKVTELVAKEAKKQKLEMLWEANGVFGGK